MRSVIFIFLNGSSFFTTCLTISVKLLTTSSISLRTFLSLFVYCFLKSKEKEMNFLFIPFSHKFMECLYGGLGVGIRTGDFDSLSVVKDYVFDA